MSILDVPDCRSGVGIDVEIVAVNRLGCEGMKASFTPDLPEIPTVPTVPPLDPFISGRQCACNIMHVDGASTIM